MVDYIPFSNRDDIKLRNSAAFCFKMLWISEKLGKENWIV
jgi:hypothetical protein